MLWNLTTALPSLCVSLARAQALHAAEKQEKLIKPMVPASIPSGSKGANLDTFGIQENPWENIHFHLDTFPSGIR